jgi:hypothetical protein
VGVCEREENGKKKRKRKRGERERERKSKSKRMRQRKQRERERETGRQNMRVHAQVYARVFLRGCLKKDTAAKNDIGKKKLQKNMLTAKKNIWKKHS